MVMIDGKKMTDGRTDGRTDRKLKRGNVECVRVCCACRVSYWIVLYFREVRSGWEGGMEWSRWALQGLGLLFVTV